MSIAQAPTPGQRRLRIEAQHDHANSTLLAGKLWCYVAVCGGTHGGVLGIAVANEPGYYPVHQWHYDGEGYREAEAEADRLNAARDIDPRAASDIVITTMRQGA